MSPEELTVEGRTPPRRRSGWRAWAGSLWPHLFVFIHLAKTVWLFRDIQFSSPYPLTNVDYIQFYARALRIHEFLRRSGRIWGYDPFDMAGYVSGPFHEVGIHLVALISHLLAPVIAIRQSMLFMEIAGLAALPFFVFPAMKLAGGTRRKAWIAFGFCVLGIGGMEPFSNTMIRIGLWGFMMSTAMSILEVGLLWRWTRKPGSASLAGVTLMAMLTLQMHPASVLILIVPNALIYAMAARRLSARRHLELLLAAAAVAAGNLFWIKPFLAFSHWRATAPYFVTNGWSEIWETYGPLQPEPFPLLQATVHWAAVALGAQTLARLWRRDRGFAVLIGTWVLSLFVISFFGSRIPWVRTLQPGRNQFAMWLVVYLLAAASFEKHAWTIPARRSFCLAILPLVLFYNFETKSAPGWLPWSKYVPSIKTTLDPFQTNFIEWVRDHAPFQGRILLECNDDFYPNFADIVPAETGAMLLGGQHPGNFLTARSTLFTSYYLVGKKIDQRPMMFNHYLNEMSEAELSRYFDLYNVQFVVARRPESLERLTKLTSLLEPYNDVPPLRIFRVRKPSSWFIQGAGQVRFDYDKITIDHASKGMLVLKTHWLGTFRSAPSMPIGPYPVADDPIPFIWIDNARGYDRIEIVNVGLPKLREWLFRRDRPRL